MKNKHRDPSNWEPGWVVLWMSRRWVLKARWDPLCIWIVMREDSPTITAELPDSDWESVEIIDEAVTGQDSIDAAKHRTNENLRRIFGYDTSVWYGFS